MLRGFYTAASGMLAQQRAQETLANNVANANTPGYKAEQATIRAFPELLMQQMGSKQTPMKNGSNVATTKPIGALNTGVYVQETISNFQQGDIRETKLQTDLAIVQGHVPDENGALFFTVQNDAGDVRYTRNGNFTVDGQGYLVTSQGYYVLNQTGNPIQMDGTSFSVTPDGIIETNTQYIPLGIAYTDNALEMVKEGNDLFAGETGAVPANANFTMKQGFLEGSNVDAVKTMTEMMNAYRMFETNQQVLKAFDESLGKAVSEIGRI